MQKKDDYIGGYGGVRLVKKYSIVGIGTGRKMYRYVIKFISK